MHCRSVRALITRQLREELSLEQSAALSRHLAGCVACRAEQVSMRQLAGYLQDRKPSSTPISAPLVAAGWTERLQQSRHRPAARRIARPPARLALSSAAAVALLALLGLQIDRRNHPPSHAHSLQIARRTDISPRERGMADRPKWSNISAKLQHEASAQKETGESPRASVRATILLLSPSNFAFSPPSRFRDKEFGARRLLRPLDDLEWLNGDPARVVRPLAAISPDEWSAIEAQIRQNVRVRDDFIRIPFPRLASLSERQIAQAAESYKREAAIVDPRLTREVTCAFKATALSDLCDRLRADTGIQLSAGPSVADEKVTLFCEKLPLRDVMRQLSRPFGYTWLRSKKEGGKYRYELVQDLKSQLLEEELRNRDRNAALLALDAEIERYRPYLDLSPDEALARAKSAGAEEKKLLEKLAGPGWGPLQLYFRLAPQELAALRAGQELKFSAEPRPGEQPLPADLARSVLQSLRRTRLARRGGHLVDADPDDPDGMPLTAVPEARSEVRLTLKQSELGRFTLGGGSGMRIAGSGREEIRGDGPYAIGMSPAVIEPDNGVVNAHLANDPELRRRISLQPESHCGEPAARTADAPPQTKTQDPKSKIAKVSSADVLEALHLATGLPIVADFYTHLYSPERVSVTDRPLFEALNRLASTMRLRWNKEGLTATTLTRGDGVLRSPDRGWLQFRSASYYDDRLKEVPNRLLARWSTARRQHGGLPLEQLLEVARLSDAQLDAADMGEGARECWGLPEWDLPRSPWARPSLRFLAGFSEGQLREAMSAGGLALSRMPLTQQQQFISLGFRSDVSPSLEELAGASLHAEYTQPGEFRWAVPGEGADRDYRSQAAEGSRAWRWLTGLSPVRERTREAALVAARRLDAQTPAAQIQPTELALTLVYAGGSPRTGGTVIAHSMSVSSSIRWGHRLPPISEP